MAGAAGGAVMSFGFAERPAIGLIAVCALLGAVLVTAVRAFATF